MPDTIFIVAGAIVLVGLVVGWGTIYRFAFKRGQTSSDGPAAQGPPSVSSYTNRDG
jgi:hypothetical protein